MACTRWSSKIARLKLQPRPNLVAALAQRREWRVRCTELNLRARTRTLSGHSGFVDAPAPISSVEAAGSTQNLAMLLLHHCRGGVRSGGSRLQQLPICSELMVMVMRAMPMGSATVSMHQESSWNALHKR